jgi:hypothetical protein
MKSSRQSKSALNPRVRSDEESYVRSSIFEEMIETVLVFEGDFDDGSSEAAASLLNLDWNAVTVAAGSSRDDYADDLVMTDSD